MSDIKEITKRRLIDAMIRSVKPANGWKVLIVDYLSMRIISAACRMYDIIEEGVTLVEKIDIPRQPLPQMEAIYFLSPTQESVDDLIHDFENLKEPQYATVHLFFTSRISDDLLGKIKKSNVVNRIKALKELNLDFIAHETNVFHFDSPQSFNIFFSPESTSNGKEQKRIADKLVSFLATMQEYPIVRYGNNATVAQSLSTMVQERLDVLMRNSVEFSSNASLEERATLLILDRSFDVMAPVLHEFTYQAMVYDLLKIENDCYKYDSVTNSGETKKKLVPISEVDPLWPTLRHVHIADAMNTIVDGFNEFIKENKASKLVGKKVNTLKDMSEAMKAMPQYQEMIDKYSIHIDLAGSAMKQFESRQLANLAMLEQDMSTGEDSDGKPVKNLISSMPPLLTDPNIEQIDKLRLLMIYIISQEGIKEADRKRLMDLAKISHSEQGCISNLRYLGVTLLKGTKSNNKQKLKGKSKKRKEGDDAPPYELSRYVPAAKKIGEDLIAGTLSTADYPAVKDDVPQTSASSSSNSKPSTSLRKSLQPKWADKNKRKSDKPSSGGKVIIFIAGGMTHSEMRCVYELSQKFKREVFLGSTSILTPETFIGNLNVLKKVETASDEGL